MIAPAWRVGALVLASILCASCDLFPEELHRRDAGVVDGGDVFHLPVADRCVDAPPLEQPVTNAKVDLTGFAHEADACGGPSGRDAWFGVPADAGERWHVHVTDRARLGSDPVLRLLQACAGDSCPEGARQFDRCGVDQDEWLSFVAPRDGTWRVALDVREGGGIYDVLVNHPVCGDDVAEHAETCEDGNTEAGDGCDSHCRAEVEDREAEPNDDPTMANVMAVSGAVTGEAGGRCDVDHFAFVHPGGAFTATVAPAEGGECDEPSMELTLMRGEWGSEPVPLAAAGPEPGSCGVVATTLEAGEHVLRVRAAPDAPSFRYRLAISGR